MSDVNPYTATSQPPPTNDEDFLIRLQRWFLVGCKLMHGVVLLTVTGLSAAIYIQSIGSTDDSAGMVFFLLLSICFFALALAEIVQLLLRSPAVERYIATASAFFCILVLFVVFTMPGPSGATLLIGWSLFSAPWFGTCLGRFYLSNMVREPKIQNAAEPGLLP